MTQQNNLIPVISGELLEQLYNSNNLKVLYDLFKIHPITDEYGITLYPLNDLHQLIVKLISQIKVRDIAIKQLIEKNPGLAVDVKSHDYDTDILFKKG